MGLKILSVSWLVDRSWTLGEKGRIKIKFPARETGDGWYAALSVCSVTWESACTRVRFSCLLLRIPLVCLSVCLQPSFYFHINRGQPSPLICASAGFRLSEVTHPSLLPGSPAFLLLGWPELICPSFSRLFI